MEQPLEDSLCKSLQGLDNVSSEGSNAFDDIAEVVDTIGEKYQSGLTWSKELQGKLTLVKRYLNGDYHIRITTSKLNYEN